MKLARTLFISAVLILMLMIVASSVVAQVTEGFESGLPTTAPTSATNYTLSSGVWTILKGVRTTTKHGGTYALNLNNGSSTASSATAPALSTVSTLSFWARGSGSSTLTVQKSVNGGAYTTVASQQITSSYALYTVAVNESGGNVRMRFQNSTSQTHYIDDVTITGNGTSVPALAASPSSLAYGNVVVNATSQKTYSLSGSLLTPASGNITVTAPTGYQVSTASGSGFASSITVAYTGGTLAARTIYVNFAPTALQAYNGNIANAGGGAATQNVAVSGIGVSTAVPALSVSSASISFGSVIVNTNSGEMPYVLSGSNLTPSSGTIAVTAPPAFQISATSGSGFASSLTVAYSGGALSGQMIFVRFTPTAVQNYSGAIANTGGGASTQNVALSGAGVTTPPAGTYYVAPNGSDTNPGTISAPFKNVQIAVNKMVPGDIVYLRGGTYYPDYMQDGTKTTIRLNAAGTANKMFSIFNYPGEVPVLNFRNQPKKVSVRGVQLNGSYWHIRGITFTEAGDNGMKLEGNHNIIEKCAFSYNDDSGLQLGFGHNFTDSHPGISSNDGSYCAYNDIIDCDSYLNYDSDNRGSDADGFSCKMHNGKSNRYIRCRAWDNSDDGWDLFETDYPVYLIECWAWGSGRASNFTVVGGSFQGNGNGIKLGGNGSGGSSKGKHEAWYCMAFNCNKTTSVKGFDQNSHGGGVKIVNCMAWGNGYDYMFETASGVREFSNDVAFGRIEIASGTIQGNNAIITNPDKGWTNNVCSNFSAADFNSLAESEAKKPRGADGSMPTTFGRLVAGSVLINKGAVVSNGNSEIADLGLPRAFTGSAPDLGPYEFGALPKTTAPLAETVPAPKVFQLLQNYPNPFNPSTVIAFSIPEDGRATLQVFDLLGREVATLVDGELASGILHRVTFEASRLSSGVYFYRLATTRNAMVKKLMIMK